MIIQPQTELLPSSPSFLPMAPVPTELKQGKNSSGSWRQAFFERREGGKLMKMLPCVLSLQYSIVFLYLINCLSRRQRGSSRFGKCEGSASPPAILPWAMLWNQGGSCIETLPAGSYFSELQAPSFSILLLQSTASFSFSSQPSCSAQQSASLRVPLLMKRDRSEVQGKRASQGDWRRNLSPGHCQQRGQLQRWSSGARH